MFHFSHSKIIESFIDVSVIYELCIFAGNLPVWLVAGRNGHSIEIDLSKWSSTVSSLGQRVKQAGVIMLVSLSPAVHAVSDKMPLCCPVKNGHLVFLLVLWLIMGIQNLNPIPLFTSNFNLEGKGLTRTENELPSCSKKWSTRRGAHYLCCAAAFIWRGDERETLSLPGCQSRTLISLISDRNFIRQENWVGPDELWRGIQICR